MTGEELIFLTSWEIITFTLSLQSDQNISYTQSISRSTSYTQVIPSFCWRQSLIAELFFAGHRKQCEKYVCESGTLESFFVTSGLYFNWEIVSINNMYLILKCKFTKTIGSLNCRCAKSYQYYWQFILQMHQHQSLESGLLYEHPWDQPWTLSHWVWVWQSTKTDRQSDPKVCKYSVLSLHQIANCWLTPAWIVDHIQSPRLGIKGKDKGCLKPRSSCKKFAAAK